MGQREEIERLIGKAYADLRTRDWLSFDRTISELSLYEWGMIEDVVSGKAMWASEPAQLRLWYIYDAVTAYPYATPPASASPSQSPSPKYPELTWEWAGGFYDGEGYFYAKVKERWEKGYLHRRLTTHVHLHQKDRTILEKLDKFTERELGILGRLEYLPERDIHSLLYVRHEDCLRLAKTIHPYLHLPLRRSQAQDLIARIKAHAQERLPQEVRAARPTFIRRYQRLLAIAG